MRPVERHTAPPSPEELLARAFTGGLGPHPVDAEAAMRVAEGLERFDEEALAGLERRQAYQREHHPSAASLELLAEDDAAEQQEAREP